MFNTNMSNLISGVVAKGFMSPGDFSYYHCSNVGLLSAGLKAFLNTQSGNQVLFSSQVL